TSKIDANALAVVIAEDRESARISTPGKINSERISATRPEPPASVRALVLGWNRRGREIARQLSCYMGPGSEMMLVADAPGFVKEASELKLPRGGVTLKHQVPDTRDRDALATLKPNDYDHVVVLSYSDSKPVQAADTHTLVTLLHLRHLAETDPKKGTIVSE